MGITMGKSSTYVNDTLLVGGAITILKNMTSSVGMMTFPIMIGKNNPNVPVTTNQFIKYYQLG